MLREPLTLAAGPNDNVGRTLPLVLCQGYRITIMSSLSIKPVFHLANLFARTDKKVGTVPTCSRRIFSPANFNQSRCRILDFASRRANKVAKWKTGFTHWLYMRGDLHSI